MEIGSFADWAGVIVTAVAMVASILAYKAQEKQIHQNRRAVINSNLTTIAGLLDAQYNLKAPGLDFLVPVVWLADAIYQEDKQTDKDVTLFKSTCHYVLKHPAVLYGDKSRLVNYCAIHFGDRNLCPLSILRYIATYVLEKPDVSEEEKQKFITHLNSLKANNPL